jgi:hypothetical protein
MEAAYVDRGIGNPTLVVGGGHSGNFARFDYTVGNDPDPILEKSITVSVNVFFRFWYRILPVGATPNGSNGSGFKWFAPWHQGSTVRWTMGVGQLPGGPVGFENTGFEFSVHDNQSPDMPNPFMQNIDKSIRFETTNDGNWHKYTLEVNNDPHGDSSGLGGYARIWIDDTRVLDCSDGQPGVPAGGYTTGPAGIELFQFIGQIVETDFSPNFTVDVDDLVVWVP